VNAHLSYISPLRDTRIKLRLAIVDESAGTYVPADDGGMGEENNDFQGSQEPPEGFRTIIAGSRGVCQYDLVLRAIREAGWPISVVISGGARGADRLGEQYAIDEGIQIERFIPKWDLFGKRAGILRNEEMADAAEALIAIWDKKSTGTKHMIDAAKSRGLKVYVLYV
jgi:hypothetical protein